MRRQESNPSDRYLQFSSLLKINKGMPENDEQFQSCHGLLRIITSGSKHTYLRDLIWIVTSKLSIKNTYNDNDNSS